MGIGELSYQRKGGKDPRTSPSFAGLPRFLGPCTVLAEDRRTRGGDDLQRAKDALARAEKRLASNDPNRRDRANIALQRALIRIQVATSGEAPGRRFLRTRIASRVTLAAALSSACIYM